MEVVQSCRRKEEEFAIGLIVVLLGSRIIQRRRRCRRKQAAVLLQNAREDDEDMSREELERRSYFKSFTRMPAHIFDILFNKIQGSITKQTTKFRDPVSAVDR
jgi:hypothetical protein